LYGRAIVLIAGHFSVGDHGQDVAEVVGDLVALPASAEGVGAGVENQCFVPYLTRFLYFVQEDTFHGRLWVAWSNSLMYVKQLCHVERSETSE
jgi:hypothetical protein